MLASARSSGIGHRLEERGAQHLDAIRRHAGRRQERIGDLLAREHEPEDVALLVGLREVDDQRDVRHVGMLAQRELGQEVDLLALDPFPAGRLDARPRPATAAADLAALHRQQHFVAAAIAADEPHAGAEHAVDDLGELIGVGAGAGMGDHQLLRQHVVESRDAARVPRHAEADFAAGAADPGELGRVELRGLVAEQRLEGGRAIDGPETGPVARRGVVEQVCEPQAAGALDVLRHDRRIARNVLAHVAGEHARMGVVAAADGRADADLDRPALVEFRRCLRRAGVASHGQRGHAASWIRRRTQRLTSRSRRSTVRACALQPRNRTRIALGCSNSTMPGKVVETIVLQCVMNPRSDRRSPSGFTYFYRNGLSCRDGTLEFLTFGGNRRRRDESRPQYAFPCHDLCRGDPRTAAAVRLGPELCRSAPWPGGDARI